MTDERTAESIFEMLRAFQGCRNFNKMLKLWKHIAKITISVRSSVAGFITDGPPLLSKVCPQFD